MDHDILALINLKKAIAINLANYNKELEQGEADRTEELRIRIDELEKLNQAMVGRELRMVDLKQENSDLKDANKHLTLTENDLVN